MERGLFYQLGALSPARFAELRAEVELAEALGLDEIWCLPRTDDAGGWQGSAPEIWLAGLAGSTERIRLGWGIPGAWPPREPPLREAEQAASLDVASGGRLDVAVLPDLGVEAVAGLGEADGAPGRGDAPPDEGVRMWVDMWATATFSWTSARFSVPPIDVVPKPVQRPHPPLWLVGWSSAHAEQAGAAGLRFLDVSGAGAAVWEAHCACYAAARDAAKPEDLIGAPCYAVAVDWPGELEATAAADPSRTERGGPAAQAWLRELESIGAERVVLRVGPLEGGHAEALRRIRWLARA